MFRQTNIGKQHSESCFLWEDKGKQNVDLSSQVSGTPYRTPFYPSKCIKHIWDLHGLAGTVPLYQNAVGIPTYLTIPIRSGKLNDDEL